ncbi:MULTISPECIES: hypothetical protein [Klebsiella pneumoniae complex]|uniref:hypothetical protein n=1 Tax=Klebsiella pneumoniae complex TaxID=3390273 RepID=UPI000E2D3672|nr:hypothetical protein [Klebsiella pneumoniae]HBW0878260.1 hypothetical protein [Klebsiella variicola]EIW4996435.1 hypothetical protein [Klebsiella pneumoniae]EIW8648734.1 hypothetical protein [Klebsiella pneumoniae]EIX9280583.1 hypothetical protein [Klebsiella pneumoniae]EIX9499243.1 hypothetical protein [Klebsiella pneumoniae]
MNANPLMPGEKYGRLTVKEYSHMLRGRRMYLCLCVCGNSCYRAANQLKNNSISSCGCMTGKKATHGQRNTRVYRIWSGMKNRCTNPNNKDFEKYSKRGICERWLTFELFLEDMGPPPTPKHQLDRKNNEGPYSKDNCRWATVTKQAENRSTSFYWFIDGFRFESAGAAANHFGVKSATIHKWCHGYNDRGINIPPRANCRKERKYG